MSATSSATCAVIRAADSREGKQGLNYVTGITSETVGARGLCLNLVTIPPGGRAKAHLHREHETAIFVVSGQAEMWYGENLAEHATFGPGDFIYIPAGVPHLPANLSGTEPCVSVIARTDPNEQESVVLLPELEPFVPGAPASS